MWTFDLETVEWDRVVSAAAVSSEGDVFYQEGAESTRALADLMRDQGGTWVAHSGGRFDTPLVLQDVPDLVDEITMTGSTILKAEGPGRLKIRDSYPLTLSSLAKLGKAVGMEKLDVDRTQIEKLDRDTLRIYNLRDCEILLKAVEALREWTESAGARPAWTAGGMAVNLFSVLEPDAWSLMCKHRNKVQDQSRATSAIRGGRVECFARGYVPGPIYVYDIKSSYPSRYHEGPLGFGVRHSKNVTELRRAVAAGVPCLVRASWISSSRTRVAPVLDASTLAGSGACEAWICAEEWQHLDDTRGVRSLTIHEGWLPRATGDVGRAFSDWCFAEKERGVPWSKLAVNAMHGKAGERPLKDNWTRGPVPDFALKEPAPRTVGDWTQWWAWGCDRRGLCPPHAQPLIAGPVLGRARTALAKGLQAVQDVGGRVFACDTDSIICDVPPESFPLPLGGALGMWAHEFTAVEGIFLGPKAYCLRSADGKIKAACKGISFSALERGIREEGSPALFREARAGETATDLRWRFFEEAAKGGARGYREGISSFVAGLHKGAWQRQGLARMSRPSGRGKAFHAAAVWSYLTPRESIETADPDLLPRSRAAVLQQIAEAAGINDHDFSRRDAAYQAWKDRGRKGPKPAPFKGGQLDAFRADGRDFCSLLEAFEYATKGAKTWRQIAPVVDMLREVPGWERASLPVDVLVRHGVESGEKGED